MKKIIGLLTVGSLLFNHSSAQETLQTVTERGSSTTKNVSIQGTGTNYIRGFTTVDSNWIFNNSVTTIGQLRTNNFARHSESQSLLFVPPTGNSNIAYGTIFAPPLKRTVTSALIASTMFQDTVVFNSNSASVGYTHFLLIPRLTQTGFSGVTRGLYINADLTNVSNFRAIETNNNWGTGYQFYAGGTAQNYFKGLTRFDSTVNFNNGINVNGTFATAQELRSNTLLRSTDATMYIHPSNANLGSHLYVGARIATVANSNFVSGVWFNDTVTFNSNVNAAGFNHLYVSPSIKQTGFNGTTRGIYVNPALTGVTDFRAIQTNVSSGAGYQIYAAGTAASYFGGNIGIGTTDTKGYKLAIAGNVVAERIVIKKQDNWPDYVFDSVYQLSSLEQVEAYIQANQHLPYIPSANEVKANGLDLGGNQAAFLRKIEELTLYAIDQHKQLKAQLQVNELQKQSITALEARLSAIEKLLGKPKK